MMDSIRSLQPGQTLWDKDEKQSVNGLHAFCLPSKKIVFYYFYRTKTGQKRKPKIGNFGQMTVAEARKAASAMAQQVALGGDPKADRNQSKAELKVGDLFLRTWKGHWDIEQYRASGWSKEVWYIYTKHIAPDFSSLRLSDVTPLKIREWHRRMDDTPRAANMALSVLGKMFSYAEEQELRPQSTNPCSIVKHHPERTRKRYATEAEIATFFSLLERESKTSTSAASIAFMYLLIFTGARPRSIERATWEQLKEFKMDGQTYGLLTFSGKSSGKSGEHERVILPPQAMKALSVLPVRPGRTLTGIKMPRTLWRRLRIEAKCPDLWMRDWRRTFATVGMSNGVDIGTIGELLNHQRTETTKIYAKVMDGTKVTAVTNIANKLEAINLSRLASIESDPSHLNS